jgi:hypothetical protein
MAILAFVNISIITGSNTYQDIQNEPKNIFFGPELNEIQPISLNSSNLAVSPSIFGHFECSWTFF